LLKTLEEPPEHVIFVLATTEPEKIPATITSRCQRFDFKRIRVSDMAERLAYIVAQEGFTAEPAALEYIARQGSGSMRDAISLLDQLTAYGAQKITLELVQTVLGAVASQSVVELVGAVITQNVAAGLDIINQVVNDGLDPRQFAREIVEYLRAVMLVKLGDGQGLLNLPEETLAVIKTQAAQADAAAIVRATTLFNTALFDLKSSLLAIPQLPLELAFVEAATPVIVPAPVVSETIVAVPPPVPRIATPVKTEPAAPRVISPAPPAQIATETVGVRNSGNLTLERVQSHLDQIIKDIEEGRTKDGRKGIRIAMALRYDSQLYRVSGKEIYFIVSDMNKEKFAQPQPRETVDEVFSRVLGQSVSVRFLSAREQGGDNAPTEEGSSNSEQSSDPLLKWVSEELGGKVVK
jgi:DNA polymerase-3 subunit gamma/tau